jgi:hypothetical protein
VIGRGRGIPAPYRAEGRIRSRVLCTR